MVLKICLTRFTICLHRLSGSTSAGTRYFLPFLPTTLYPAPVTVSRLTAPGYPGYAPRPYTPGQAAATSTGAPGSPW
nr:unnamed protein product [Digitaria exilis]